MNWLEQLKERMSNLEAENKHLRARLEGLEAMHEVDEAGEVSHGRVATPAEAGLDLDFTAMSLEPDEGDGSDGEPGDSDPADAEAPQE